MAAATQKAICQYSKKDLLQFEGEHQENGRYPTGHSLVKTDFNEPNRPLTIQ